MEKHKIGKNKRRHIVHKRSTDTKGEDPISTKAGKVEKHMERYSLLNYVIVRNANKIFLVKNQLCSENIF